MSQLSVARLQCAINGKNLFLLPKSRRPTATVHCGSSGSSHRLAALPSSVTVVLLLFGLLRSGAVRLRVIDGAKEMSKVATKAA